MPDLRTFAGIVSLLGLAALAALAPRPPVDNSVGALLSSDGPETRRYRAFSETFGTDELVLVHIEGPDPKTLLVHATAAQAALQDSPAAEHVVGPALAYPELCEALGDEVAKDLLDPQAAARTLAGPLATALPLLELDPPRATVLGFGRTSAPEVRAALRAELERIRASAEAQGVRLEVAGPPLLNLYLDEAGRDVERTALPLLLLVAVGLMLLTTRSPAITAALLAPVGLGVASSDALLGLAGGTANVMVNVVKPLLFVLQLAAGLHVATRFVVHRRADLPPGAAAWAAAKDKARPTALALFTTAVGFGSLGLSEVAPIRTFGLLSAAGLLLAIPSTLLGLPVLLGLLARGAPKPGRSLEQLAARLVQFGLRRPAPSVLLGVLIVALGFGALPSLEAEPHAIRYFEPDHPLRADYESLEANGLGLSSLEIVLTATGAWPLDAAALAPVEALRAEAASEPGVKAALALPLLLREAAYQVRGNAALPEAGFAAEALAARPGQARLLLSEDRRHLRLSLLIETLDADQLDTLERRLRGRAQALLPRVEANFTGSYALLLRAQRSLLATLQQSLLVTLVLMELILLVFLRRPGLAAVALLPNLAPVALNFVVMALLGIPVDLGTSMTAAVALGIAVDDTLHVAVAWRPEAPESVAARAGHAIVISSIVIGAGFLVLTTSSFGPTKSFGLLAGLAMLSALFGDLVLLPPLLRWLDRRRGNERSAG